MIKLAEIIIEGRYNEFVGKLTKVIMTHIKASTSKKSFNTKFEVNPNMDTVGFTVKLQIDRISDMRLPVDISAFTVTDPENELLFNIEISTSKKKPESTNYTLLVPEIKDALRHEIEHFTQEGRNKRPGKERSTSGLKIRTKATESDNMTAYFLLRDEVPAYVHGLYTRAKYNHSALDTEMLKYLTGWKLSQADINKVMKVWLTFAKRMLPHAKYSENN